MSPPCSTARALVQSATSLVKHLDADALDLVVEHVERGQLVGRWTQTEKAKRVRDDGHLEKSTRTTTLWLRPNFEAQLENRHSWKSYRGATVWSGGFGGGGS